MLPGAAVSYPAAWVGTDAAGEPWRPDPAAEVLVLGDSFANIYSLEMMG